MMRETQPLFASTRARRYRGGCQCGCVVYEASLDLASAHEAAPSVWERQARSFKVVRGEEMLRGYQFSAAGVHHFYCERCGSRAFSHVSSLPCGEFYSVDLKSLHVVGTPADPRPDQPSG
jgi:hypothetical protein